jgi:hypothetical protein
MEPVGAEDYFRRRKCDLATQRWIRDLHHLLPMSRIVPFCSDAKVEVEQVSVPRVAVAKIAERAKSFIL